eukprot:TRINITY_DN2735_c0_g2_i4.p1 TRINITY_DN2735_c0_g2~~TRINITY_DN2735_c0_g2_i4.p1  ORF type:complete len:538 (-),score=101.66 TRINITY_DN2735_c0_g2_i4:40-1653(-)
MADSIQAVVASTKDFRNGEMREVPLGEHNVLLFKEKDQFYATGTKCTHYGAPLKNGTFSNGRVRCPWHGACFNVKTGDIEDYPGLECLTTYDVRIEGDNVVVSATASSLAQQRKTKPLSKRQKDTPVFVVIGGGAAGGTAVEILRQEGFTGRLLLISKENNLPYDRPKLSKAMTITVDKIQFRDSEFYKQHDIEVKLQTEVVELNALTKTIKLSDGETIKYDGAIIASGGSAHDLAFIKGAQSKNIFTLRSIEDAHAIISAVENQNVVIVGSSFIGMEVASCIAAKVKSVIVVGMEKVPFERVLGTEVGSAMKKFHESNKVQFRLEAITDSFSSTPDGKVSGVVLKSGEVLPASVVIIGAGIKLNTGFVKEGVTKDVDQSLIADKYLKVAEGLYAAGDLVKFPFAFLNNDKVRIEHWGSAQTQGKIAALNLLGKQIPFDNIPVFWTVQYGKSLRYCGYAFQYDEVVLDVEKDWKEKLTFVAFYTKGDKILAVASLNRDPIVVQCAELMAQGKMPTVSQLKEVIKKEGNSASIFKAKL